MDYANTSQSEEQPQKTPLSSKILFLAQFLALTFLTVIKGYASKFDGADFFLYGTFTDLYRTAWHIESAPLLALTMVFLIVLLLMLASVFLDMKGKNRGKWFIQLAFMSPSILFIGAFAGLIVWWNTEMPNSKAQDILKGLTQHVSISRTSDDFPKAKCAAIIATTSTHHLVWDYSARYHFTAIPLSTVSDISPASKALPDLSNTLSLSDDKAAFIARVKDVRKALNEWLNEFLPTCPKALRENHPAFKVIADYDAFIKKESQ